MKTIKQIKQETKEIHLGIASKIKEAEALFKSELPPLLDGLKRVEIYVNNHEFNDGDATYFGFNYEELTVVTEDELGNEYEYNGYPKKENTEIDKKRKVLMEFFDGFNFEGFYEKIFGDQYETVRFSVSDGKLIIE